MKTLLSILSFILVACSTPTPQPPAPAPSGLYLIREFDSKGIAIHSWEVPTYRETAFPSTVTFDSDGKTITLRGSYQIDKFPSP